MNAQTAPSRSPNPVVPFVATVRPAPPRERDFGVGYGKSSGYATSRRYVTQPATPRFFRFA